MISIQYGNYNSKRRRRSGVEDMGRIRTGVRAHKVIWKTTAYIRLSKLQLSEKKMGVRQSKLLLRGCPRWNTQDPQEILIRRFSWPVVSIDARKSCVSIRPRRTSIPSDRVGRLPGHPSIGVTWEQCSYLQRLRPAGANLRIIREMIA